MNEFFIYLRAILYLFSVYNVVSIGIVRFQERKSLFWIHMSVATLLFLNFIAILLVRIFKFAVFEAIIFDYGVNFVLIVLNILAWGRLYFSRERENIVKNSSEFLKNLNLEDIDNKEISIKGIINSSNA